MNDDDQQKKLVKELQDADKLINSDDEYNTYFKKYAAFIISISLEQMNKLRNYGNDEVLERLWKDFQYSRIIVSDIIFLKNIFQRIYDIDITKADIIKIVYCPPAINGNVHPDTILGYELYNSYNIENKYIGVSHLCCILCSLFLDTYGFSFRGTSKRFEFWLYPVCYSPNTEEHEHLQQAFAEKFKYLKTSVKQKQEIKFLTGEQLSSCKNWSDIMAIEICKYYEILQTLAPQTTLNKIVSLLILY